MKRASLLPRPFLPVAALALLGAACAGKAAVSPAPPPPAAPPAATAPPPIRLIVQGDDMGALHGINLGIVDSHRNGVLRVVEVIVPGPWLPEAIKLLDENPTIDVGIHLALTSEWENVKWRPLTHAPSLTDEDGYFYPMVWPRDDFPPRTSLREARPDLAEVERELRAQITLLKKHVPRLSHATTHMGFGSASPAIVAIVDKLRAEFGLAPAPPGLKRLPVQRPPGADKTRPTTEQRIVAFVAALETIGPGDYVFVEHPATDDDEMRAVSHKGYEDVAADRAAVTAVYTDARVKDAIARRGIQLVGYRDLSRQP